MRRAHSRPRGRLIPRRPVLADIGDAQHVGGAEDPGFTRISPQQLNDMLAKKDFFFVNVHIPYEGDIAGTDADIAYGTIAANLDKLPAKDQKIVIYCRSGRMSTIAAAELAKLGYTQVVELEGGMKAWKAAGYPIVMR